jgi:hypothetical protein
VPRRQGLSGRCAGRRVRGFASPRNPRHWTAECGPDGERGLPDDNAPSGGEGFHRCFSSRERAATSPGRAWRLLRLGSSAQREVRVLSAGRNTGSGADSVDAVEAVGSALIFCPASEKERNFSATGSVS